MRIEKVNENQIRCTLTREDLADRQLKLSELAYGSEKARNLFRDMIQQANYEFGFEVDDIPLMVEAIPLSSESIILVITKVEYPEELDTRFSNFTDPEDKYLEEKEEFPSVDPLMKGADDILDLFRKMQEEEDEDEIDQVVENQLSVTSEDIQAGIRELIPRTLSDLVNLFEFRHINEVQRLARMISGYYNGENDLYKDPSNDRFYLMVHKGEHTPEQFNKICNMMAEYAQQKNYTEAIGAYLMEHGKMILDGDALQVLATI